MHRIVLPVSALLTGVALLMIANGLLTSLIGVRLGQSGAGAFSNGLIVSGYFFGLLLGALLSSRILQQVGHIRTFSALASLFSAASLLHAFNEGALVWWGLRVIEGLCMAGLFICAESWLNERADNATRGTILSIYTLTAGLGTGLGQLLLATFPVEGFVLFALSSVLLSLAVVPVALTRTPGPALLTSSRLALRALWKVSPLGVSGCAASGMLLGAFYGMGPIFGLRMGLDPSGVAWFMGAAIIGGMLLQWPMGRLSDRVDRRWAILGNGFGMALFSLGIVAVTAGQFSPEALDTLPFDADMLPDPQAFNERFQTWIGPLVVGFGALAFTLYPLSVAQANDHAKADGFVAMSGGLILSYSAGAMAGPVLASLLMEGMGPLGLFAFTALTGLLLGGFSLWRMRRSPAVPPEEQAPFQPVPRTSVAAYALDPRQTEGNRFRE
ncbi:MFS transporter [Magnetospira thiophila]